ncbi:MAG: B12-binding domain-containing radical SAM protein [Euryarchaeota archaeon]|nr:B12-binding domain-containing radical SAM protein [Euryarchaeota archaeon]
MAAQAPAATKGVPIVLSASRAEMSHFGYNPFIAFTCTFPQAFTKLVLQKYFAPDDLPDGRARFAPYGLRKVEALLAAEFGAENVVVSHYSDLDRFVGPATRVFAATSMDPMGLAYVSTTYNSLIGVGGESLNAVEFRRLMNHPALRRHRPRMLVGGSGVWQIRDTNSQSQFGIDLLFQGESERDLVGLVRKLLAGEKLPPYFVAGKPKWEDVPQITGAATYGTVEIMRGCGRGCAFCTPTMRKRRSVPVEQVMREVGTTVKCGSRAVFTTSEDIFLYECGPRFVPNREKIVELYTAISRQPGLDYILLSHASLAPVVYDPKIPAELAPLLLAKTPWNRSQGYRQDFITVEVGIETGSVRLMQKYMRGKALPFSVDNWPELVVQGVGVMNDSDWWPLCTIMTGMPDETEADVIATLELVDDLRASGARMFYTPVIFIPLEEAILSKARRSDLKNFTGLQWEFIMKCWRNNMDFWMPQIRGAVGVAASLYFFSYLFWKHGGKIGVPMKYLMGFPYHYTNKKVGKECDRDYCLPSRERHRTLLKPDLLSPPAEPDQ